MDNDAYNAQYPASSDEAYNAQYPASRLRTGAQAVRALNRFQELTRAGGDEHAMKPAQRPINPRQYATTSPHHPTTGAAAGYYSPTTSPPNQTSQPQYFPNHPPMTPPRRPILSTANTGNSVVFVLHSDPTNRMIGTIHSEEDDHVLHMRNGNVKCILHVRLPGANQAAVVYQATGVPVQRWSYDENDIEIVQSDLPPTSSPPMSGQQGSASPPMSPLNHTHSMPMSGTGGLYGNNASSPPLPQNCASRRYTMHTLQ
jgi:hypothetical protein